MQIILKTLTNKLLHVDIDNDKSIEDLKSKIENIFGNEYKSNSTKLIFKGNLLENHQMLNNIGYTDHNFIVILSTFKSECSNNQPTESNKNIYLITEMGFSEEQALYALNESGNNLGNAVEFLLNFTEGNNMNNMIENFKSKLKSDPNLLQSMVQDMRDDPELKNLIPDNDDFGQSDTEIVEETNQDNEPDQDESCLTLGDLQNIDTICAMGFDEDQCIEAYLAFGKDFEETINYLVTFHG